MDDGLLRAAATALDCLGLTAGEELLVVCNPETETIAEALGEAAARARILRYPRLSRHGEEPPAEVAEAMRQAAVAAAPTFYSLSHTEARREATRRGARIATLPGITEEIFRRALPVDYGELERAGDRLAALLSAASACRITAPGGTDVRLELTGREGRNDDGDLRAPGAFGNLPAGEAYVAPVETGGDGVIVFDGSLAGYGLLQEPLRLELAGGRLAAAAGEAAEWLLATLDAAGETGRLIAELGIGTNPAARITGVILEDEKAAGTAHLAFGTSAGIGGRTVSTVHIDGLVLRPTIELDGEVVVRDGVPR